MIDTVEMVTGTVKYLPNTAFYKPKKQGNGNKISFEPIIPTKTHQP